MPGCSGLSVNVCSLQSPTALKMFKIVLICAVIGLAAAMPAGEDAHADVVSRKDDVRADGFDSGFETSNHITRSESGDEHGNIHGSFGWISPEGEHIDLTYVADEHGYQPQGSVLPTPHPIPVEIERAIAYINAHPSAENH